MKRILSGIKPTGEVTLGNYLGAMKRWASEQEGRENYYFVPNLHALTIRQDSVTLLHNSYAALAWLLAMGVDTKLSHLYIQSQIPQHSELMWILSNYTTMGELNRMTQFKDKSQKVGMDGQLVGLFTYPILMASDILLYDADEVPVGDDQKQHVELARDIATRFNNLYGHTFKLPVATTQKSGARIMDLQYPHKKMSKSDDDTSGCIIMTDSLDSIRQKIMKAQTDSYSSIEFSRDRPAIANLLTIFSLMSGISIKQLEADYVGKGYGDFKRDLADIVLSVIEPLQNKYNKLMANTLGLDDILSQSHKVVSAVAEEKLSEVKSRVGLL